VGFKKKSGFAFILTHFSATGITHYAGFGKSRFLTRLEKAAGSE
jgi:hypothetical protein